MTLNVVRPLRRAFPAVAALALLALSGCVAYPAGPGYGYAYAPGPVVVAPAPVVVGVGCCWGGRGWGGGWHR